MLIVSIFVIDSCGSAARSLIELIRNVEFSSTHSLLPVTSIYVIFVLIPYEIYLVNLYGISITLNIL